jgi:RNA polymerase sigma-70 factor, ECF subfamily
MAAVFDEGPCRELHAAGKLEEAATEAIRGLTPQILRYLGGILRDEEEAHDAHSMWAENLWKGLPAFRWESSLRVWAYRLAWNAALKLRDEAWRKRGRRLRTTEASALAEQARRSSMMLHEARAQKVSKLRASLEPEEQSLLSLRLDQELSWKEISQVLSAIGQEPIAEATLRKRFERIKEKLAQLARREGLL